MNPYFFLKQLVGDYWDCGLDENIFNSAEFMIEAAKEAVKRSNSIVLKYLDHKFEPQGYTLLMVLADSSLILHSWPEEKYICVEIFTCTDKSLPIEGLNYLADIFHPKKFDIHKIERK